MCETQATAIEEAMASLDYVWDTLVANLVLNKYLIAKILQLKTLDFSEGLPNCLEIKKLQVKSFSDVK